MDNPEILHIIPVILIAMVAAAFMSQLVLNITFRRMFFPQTEKKCKICNADIDIVIMGKYNTRMCPNKHIYYMKGKEMVMGKYEDEGTSEAEPVNNTTKYHYTAGILFLIFTSMFLAPNIMGIFVLSRGLSWYLSLTFGSLWIISAGASTAMLFSKTYVKRYHKYLININFMLVVAGLAASSIMNYIKGNNLQAFSPIATIIIFIIARIFIFKLVPVKEEKQ